MTQGATYDYGFIEVRNFCKLNESEICNIRNTTRISFDIKCTSTTEDTATSSYLAFYRRYGDPLKTNPGFYNTSFKVYTGSNKACKFQDIGSYCTGSWLTFNKTLAQIEALDPDCNIDYDLEIDSFILGFGAKNVQDWYVDNVYFDYLSGINELPVVNITPSERFYCFNSTGENVTLTLNYSEYDREGDTVYYAYQYLSNKNLFSTIKYSEQSCTFFNFYCEESIDYKYKDLEFYPNSNYCKINSSQYYDPYAFNIVPNPDEENDAWALQIDGTLSGCIPDLWYRLEKDVDNMFYYSEFYGFEDTEIFNISFLDFSYNPVVQLQFRKIGSTIEVYDYNGSAYNLQLNDTQGENFGFSITGLSYSGSNLLIFTNIAGSDIGNITLLLDDSIISYVVISPSNTTILLQQEFQYSGVALTPAFSVNRINSIETDRYGLVRYRIFTSDSEHQPDTYNSTVVTFTVLDYDNPFCYAGPISGIFEGSAESQKDVSKFWFFFRFFKLTFGDSTKAYLTSQTTFNGNTYWSIFVPVMGFFLLMEFIGILLFTALINKHADFRLAFLIIGLEGFLVSLWLSYVEGQVIFGILFGIGLALPFASDATGRRSQG